MLRDISSVKTSELIEAAGTEDIDLIAGGPSCQGFSTHGKRIEHDPRNFLFKEFVRVVGDIRPKFILMENVKGLLTYSRGHFEDVIRESFTRIGYRIASATLCAADFGVPQMRHRIMFIGTRLDDVDLSFPSRTHGVGNGLTPFVTVEDAIGDLPRMNGELKRVEWDYSSSPQTPFQEYARRQSGTSVTLHQANRLSEQAAPMARFIGQGEGLRSVPHQYLPDRFKKMRRISNGELRRDCTTLYHRLDPNKPSYTITCYYRNVASGPFMHPWEDRSLSHREAARLMSFPDHYQFMGASHPRQIGNAVPPLMAAAVGRQIIKLLNNQASQSQQAA
jgi:DNA (cytosine-5)-methyltransferase 1